MSGLTHPERSNPQSSPPSSGVIALTAIATLLLLSATGFVLLQHCGIAVPHFLTGGRSVMVFDFCGPQTPRTDTLSTLVTERERAAMARRQRCELAPEEPPPPVDDEDVSRRLDREDAAVGALAVTLAWNGVTDLDLIVVCPDNTHIYYGNTEGCGGRLQVDMNAGSNKSAEPVENIFWPTDQMPAGRYTVHVSCHSPKADCLGGIPFTLVVEDRQGNEIARVSDSATIRAKKSNRTPMRFTPATLVATFDIG